MELREYALRICVAGSRSFHDSIKFDSHLKAYVEWLKGMGVEQFAFISGGAKRGPDALIIEWARKHGYECFVMEADWKKYGTAAGPIRNAEMSEVLTHLLAFWDGESKGTQDMVEGTMGMDTLEREIALIMVTPDSGWKEYQKRIKSYKLQKGKKENNHAWKSKGRRGRVDQRT